MSKKNHVVGKPGLDPTLPDVSLIIAGVERHLCFDFNAIVLTEKVTGINILKAALDSDINATNIRGLLWASLVKENPDLTIEEVGSWITMHNLFNVKNALTLAWLGSVTEDEESESEKGKPEAQE
jgi:hypothetical protein